MSAEEYWIGKNVDVRKLWADVDDGVGYIDKFHTMSPYALRITFEQPASSLPLFFHEAIYKSIKFSFHELKYLCYSRQDYDRSGPLFLYSVDRGSSQYTFLGDLRQLILYGTTLADERLIGQRIENLNSIFRLLQNAVGPENVFPEDFEELMHAKGSSNLEEAFIRIYKKRILRVELSTCEFSGNIEPVIGSMVDLKV